MVFVLAREAARLTEPVVHERLASAGHDRVHPLEHLASGHVLVEPLIDEVPLHAAAL